MDIALKFSVILSLTYYGDSKQTNLRMRAFTPGTATTSAAVKTALADDVQYDEDLVIDATRYIMDKTLEIGGLSKDNYYALPVPGSAIYSTEACVRHFTPTYGKVLILTNGYFGNRFIDVCKLSGIDYHALSWDEGEEVNVDEVKNHLQANPNYTTVTLVHYESTTTQLNPAEEISRLIKTYIPHASFIVDGVGTFACFDFDISQLNIDCFILLPAKCVQNFFGYSIALLNKNKFNQFKGNSHSYALDLKEQIDFFDEFGYPLFTLSTQLLMSTKQSLVEHFEEGINKKMERYRKNRQIIRNGFVEMGWVPFLSVESGTDLATAFHLPTHVFNYSVFQYLLEKTGNFLHPREWTKLPLVRVAHFGAITSDDCEEFLTAVKLVLQKMKIKVPFFRGPFVTKENTGKWLNHHAIP